MCQTGGVSVAIVLLPRCHRGQFIITTFIHTKYLFWDACVMLKKHTLNFDFRYKLQLLVQDLTGESNIILLDSAARTIVNASAAKLLNGSYDKVINYLFI